MTPPSPDPARVLDPAMQTVLARAAAWRIGKPDRYGQPFSVARELLLAERQAWQDDTVPACTTTDFTLAGARPVPVRACVPARPVAGAPLIVYLHGGGWCVGSVDTHDALVRHLAGATGCEVWSADYALAPEAPYPAGLLDAAAVLDAAIARDRTRTVFVGGDSAGANLALAACLLRRDRGLPLPAGLLLYYGIYTDAMDDASHAAFGDGRFGLSRAANQRYLAEYVSGGLAAPFDRRYLFPLDAGADLRGLPPALVVAAGCDILHDQSMRLHAALAAAGAASETVEVAGVIHGFLAYGGALPQVAATWQRTREFVFR